MNLNVLFWNICGNDRDNEKMKACIEAILSLCTNHEIDILVLAECPKSLRDTILDKLKGINPNYYYANNTESKVAIYHKVNGIFEDRIDAYAHPDNQRYSSMKLGNTFFVGLHLECGLSKNEDKLTTSAEIVKQHISWLAGKNQLDSIIVVGDFNLDPFERGMVTYPGFNSTFVRHISKKKPKIVRYPDRNDKHPYFFNPSWMLFGKYNTMASGTYFTKGTKGDRNEIYYHMLDQVLITSDLIDRFDLEHFEIITKYHKDGTDIDIITKDGIPKREIYSDHLPIRFRINLCEGEFMGNQKKEVEKTPKVNDCMKEKFEESISRASEKIGLRRFTSKSPGKGYVFVSKSELLKQKKDDVISMLNGYKADFEKAIYEGKVELIEINFGNRIIVEFVIRNTEKKDIALFWVVVQIDTYILMSKDDDYYYKNINDLETAIETIYSSRLRLDVKPESQKRIQG